MLSKLLIISTERILTFMLTHLATIADLGCLLQKVVTYLPQLHVLEADFVGGIAGGGKDAVMHYRWVVTSLTDTC